MSQTRVRWASQNQLSWVASPKSCIGQSCALYNHYASLLLSQPCWRFVPSHAQFQLQFRLHLQHHYIHDSCTFKIQAISTTTSTSRPTTIKCNSINITWVIWTWTQPLQRRLLLNHQLVAWFSLTQSKPFWVLLIRCKPFHHCIAIIGIIHAYNWFRLAHKLQIQTPFAVASINFSSTNSLICHQLFCLIRTSISPAFSSQFIPCKVLKHTSNALFLPCHCVA